MALDYRRLVPCIIVIVANLGIATPASAAERPSAETQIKLELLQPSIVWSENLLNQPEVSEVSFFGQTLKTNPDLRKQNVAFLNTSELSGLLFNERFGLFASLRNTQSVLEGGTHNNFTSIEARVKIPVVAERTVWKAQASERVYLYKDHASAGFDSKFNGFGLDGNVSLPRLEVAEYGLSSTILQVDYRVGKQHFDSKLRNQMNGYSLSADIQYRLPIQIKQGLSVSAQRTKRNYPNYFINENERRTDNTLRISLSVGLSNAASLTVAKVRVESNFDVADRDYWRLSISI